MDSRKKTRQIALMLTIMVLISAGCQSDEIEYYCEDRYLETPKAPVMLEVRMMTAMARPRTETGRGFADISERELYLFAKMIECEARYEPYEGKIAVGAVILNRVNSPRFPNTIEGVIFQKGQFQPITDGGWESKEPSDLAFRAAREALQGKRPNGGNGQSVGDALFFIYEDLAGEGSTRWFKEKLKYVTTIGNHDFYSY